MEVLLVRHAVAGERDPKRWPDDRERPLTSAGARKFRQLARALCEVFPKVDEVWSSPLKRAWRTGTILAEVAAWPAPQELALLEPGARPEGTVAFLRKRGSTSRIVLVGHEPGLSEIASHLVARDANRVRFEMKKGGALLLRFPGDVAAGAAILVWLLPPRILLPRDG